MSRALARAAWRLVDTAREAAQALHDREINDPNASHPDTEQHFEVCLAPACQRRARAVHELARELPMAEPPRHSVVAWPTPTAWEVAVHAGASALPDTYGWLVAGNEAAFSWESVLARANGATVVVLRLGQGPVPVGDHGEVPS